MVKLVNGLEKFDNVVSKLQNLLLLIGVMVMIIINGAQVFCRYVIHSSLSWSEQISVMLYFILIMFGANLAVRSDNETKIDILKFKDERKNIILHIITDLICIVVLCVFVASSIALLQQASVFPQYLSSVHLNYFFIYLWLPIGFILVLYQKILSLLKRICVLSGKMDASALMPKEGGEE